MNISGDLVSRATRTAVRRLVSQLYKGAIIEYWENEGFKPAEIPISDAGVRQRTFDSYAADVDWSNLEQVARALRVFESILRRLERDGAGPEAFDEARDELARDGYRLTEQIRILSLHPQRLALHLDKLVDPSGIHSELERIRRVVADYPDDAIGAAKQLVEATAKVVLRERGIPCDERHDLPELVKEAQKALSLHASKQQATPDGTESVKKILGGLSGIAVGLAELRNRYGTGHGRSSAPSGLALRHARLAVNAATTWCEMVLDTLADPRAPWRVDDT
ncbi:abortive infection family protein [Microtetraspora malaysiensis]|uniref:Abortive infection family protein n=1 Tax=Microtetraspora malaysiensis TaxID=161358 RepID=A0ABW6T2V6_9ACTN